MTDVNTTQLFGNGEWSCWNDHSLKEPYVEDSDSWQQSVDRVTYDRSPSSHICASDVSSHDTLFSTVPSTPDSPPLSPDTFQQMETEIADSVNALYPDDLEMEMEQQTVEKRNCCEELSASKIETATNDRKSHAKKFDKRCELEETGEKRDKDMIIASLRRELVEKEKQIEELTRKLKQTELVETELDCHDLIITDLNNDIKNQNHNLINKSQIIHQMTNKIAEKDARLKLKDDTQEKPIESYVQHSEKQSENLTSKSKEISYKQQTIENQEELRKKKEVDMYDKEKCMTRAKILTDLPHNAWMNSNKSVNLSEQTKQIEPLPECQLLQYISDKDLETCLLTSNTTTQLVIKLLKTMFSNEDLAEHSAFGQGRSSRPALDTGKITAIIGFVQRKNREVPKSRLILAINQACCDARKPARRHRKQATGENYTGTGVQHTLGTPCN